MAAIFTVEDGTGLTTANSYSSVADATQYHEDNGDPVSWSSATQATQENGLRRATQYLDAKYGLRWKGVRANDTQALDWPRTSADDADGYALDSDSLPTQLEHATAELAIKVVEGDSLFEDSIPGGDAGGGVQREAVQIGSIKEDITYLASKGTQKRYTLAERLVAGLITSGSTGARA